MTNLPLKDRLIIIMAKFFFYILKLFPINKKKIVLECDLGKGLYGNPLQILKELRKEKLAYEIVVPLNNLRTANIKDDKVKLVKTRTLSHLYHLATSKFWITNNHYYYFLTPKKNTVFINTWHAMGAFKKFGLDSVKSKADFRRFKLEGENINYLLVSSDSLVDIYSQALNVAKDKILCLGTPRADKLFNLKYLEKERKTILKNLGLLKNKKKIILYAPTFRDGEKDNFKFKFDFKKLYTNLNEDYIFWVKLHPIIKNKVKIPIEYKNFIYDMSKEDINNLMIASDLLITDYSSIIYEYSILRKPILFYTFDLNTYENEMRGFYKKFQYYTQNNMYKTEEEIIRRLKGKKIDLKFQKEFLKENCKYRDNKSTQRFIDKFLREKISK